MLDATRQKTKLLNRTRRMRGQFEALERALEKDVPCSEALQLIAGTAAPSTDSWPRCWKTVLRDLSIPCASLTQTAPERPKS